MENIQRHNEFVFYIQIEKVLFWSWIWQINIIQKTLLHQVIIGSAVHSIPLQPKKEIVVLKIKDAVYFLNRKV